MVTGPVTMDVPGDRRSESEPVIVPMGKRRLTRVDMIVGSPRRHRCAGVGTEGGALVEPCFTAWAAGLGRPRRACRP